MERVKTLLNKLEEQLGRHASAEQLLHTVQMLQGELVQRIQSNARPVCDNVCIVPPIMINLKLQEPHNGQAQADGAGSAAGASASAEPLKTSESAATNIQQEVAQQVKYEQPHGANDYEQNPVEEEHDLQQQEASQPEESAENSVTEKTEEVTEFEKEELLDRPELSGAYPSVPDTATDLVKDEDRAEPREFAGETEAKEEEPVKIEPQTEDKVVEVLNVDEKEIEDELNQIKEKAARANSASSKVKTQYLFDPLEDIPTLSQQDSANQSKAVSPGDLSSFEYPESLNDRLKEERIELSQSLTNAPIKDLRKAIGVNDRYVFINELFRGDEAMYERSIKTIQNFSIYAEAEFWIRRELRTKLGWQDHHPTVKEFMALVKRRFA